MWVIFQTKTQSFKIKKCVVSEIHPRWNCIAVAEVCESIPCYLFFEEKIASTQNGSEIAGSMEIDQLFTIYYKIE